MSDVNGRIADGDRCRILRSTASMRAPILKRRHNSRRHSLFAGGTLLGRRLVLLQLGAKISVLVSQLLPLVPQLSDFEFERFDVGRVGSRAQVLAQEIQSVVWLFRFL